MLTCVQSSCTTTVYSCNLLIQVTNLLQSVFFCCKIPIQCQITSGSQCNQGSRERFRAISLHFQTRYFPHCRSRDGFPDSRLGRISRFPDLISGISRLRPLEHSCLSAQAGTTSLTRRGPAALAKPHFTAQTAAALHTTALHYTSPLHYTSALNYTSALHYT